MTDRQIIKALRCCTSQPSVERCRAECAYYHGGNMAACIPLMGSEAADRLAALADEAARLKAENRRIRETHYHESVISGLREKEKKDG